MSGLSHKNWWVVGLVASLAIVVVVVHAAIPDASGVIHACYRANGNLRLVDKSSCTSSETALTWNQTGPQGPAGAPGPQGAPGPAALLDRKALRDLRANRAHPVWPALRATKS